MLSLYHDKLQAAFRIIGQQVQSSVSHHHYTLGLWVSAHNYTLWQQHPWHRTGGKTSCILKKPRHLVGRKERGKTVTGKGSHGMQAGDMGYTGQDAHEIQQDWGRHNGGACAERGAKIQETRGEGWG